MDLGEFPHSHLNTKPVRKYCTPQQIMSPSLLSSSLSLSSSSSSSSSSPSSSTSSIPTISSIEDASSKEECTRQSSLSQSSIDENSIPEFQIIESTLREGEQFSTAFFDTETKLKIAVELDRFRVDYVGSLNSYLVGFV